MFASWLGLISFKGSLRLVQHVETIQAPTSFKEFHLKTWKELSWVVKRFQVCVLSIFRILRSNYDYSSSDCYCSMENRV